AGLVVMYRPSQKPVKHARSHMKQSDREVARGLEIITSGGWLVTPIVLCSAIVLGISLERYWTLNTAELAPPHLLAQVWGWIKNNQVDASKLRELKQSSKLGQILAAGLSNSKHGREVMKDSIQESASQVVHELERYISVLGTIANIAPLLGLLGTVIGMIQVFNAIMIQGTGN